MKYVHVPFQGGAPAITAMLGNHVDALVLTLPPTVPQIGRASCAASASPATSAIRRSRMCRPTARWAIPNVYSGSWVGFFAPAKTPDAVVDKLNAEINAVMKEPDSLDKLAKAGFDPVVKSVAEANDYYKSEVESWGKMVRAIGFSNELTIHRSWTMSARAISHHACAESSAAMNAARRTRAGVLDAAATPENAPRWKRSPRNMPSPSRRQWPN